MIRSIDKFIDMNQNIKRLRSKVKLKWEITNKKWEIELMQIL